MSLKPNQWQYWKQPSPYNTDYEQAKNALNQLPNALGVVGKMQSKILKDTQDKNAQWEADQQIKGQQFADIYGQAQKAYDPTAIANLYAKMYGGLGRAQGAAVSNERRLAAQQGASASLLNPGSYVMAAGQAARAPYILAAERMMQNEAEAQMAGQKGLMEVQYLLNRASTGDADAAARLDILRKQLELQRQQLQAQIDAQEADFFDYVGAAAPIIGNLIAPGIGGIVGGVAGSGLSNFSPVGVKPYTGQQYVNGKLPWQ